MPCRVLRGYFFQSARCTVNCADLAGTEHEGWFMKTFIKINFLCPNTLLIWLSSATLQLTCIFGQTTILQFVLPRTRVVCVNGCDQC